MTSMETRVITNPLSAYSWEIISDTLAIKQMDKSSFLHHGTGIPKEIAPFFNLSETELNKPKPVLLEVNDKAYNAHFQMESVLQRFRLFWKADFSNLIKNRYPEFHKIFANDESTDAETPKMQFERIDQNSYRVEFLNASTIASDWTDEEPDKKANAVLKKMISKPEAPNYITATINEIQSRDRSYIYISSSDQHYFPEPNKKFRIIDPVNDETYDIHLENSYRIPGLRAFFKSHPEIKVGTKILIVPLEQYKTYNIYIDHILHELNQDIYLPTTDADELENRVKAILKKGPVGKPEGQTNPKKQQSAQTIYARDPLVQAWTIQNAEGICELCDQKGPFIDKSGQYYLEAHHVVFLAQSGADTTENAVALCPNCHRKCHHAQDTDAVREKLKGKIERIQQNAKQIS